MHIHPRASAGALAPAAVEMKPHNRHLEERLIEDGGSSEAPPCEGLPHTTQASDSLGVQAQLPSPRSSSESLFFRVLLIVKIAFGFFLGIVLFLVFTHFNRTAQIVTDLINGVQHLGSLAPLAYIGLYVVFIACFLPAEFMHLAAGFIFSRIYGEGLGIVVAFLCSLCGSLLSGLCCFMISRHLLYDSLHAWMRNNMLFRAFDSAVEEGGLTFVALIRLSPILPYSLTSYLFGVTALKTSHLVLGTFSGTPLILAFNFVGSALSDLNDLDIHHFSWNWQRLSLVALGVMMAAASMAYITMLTRRKLETAYASAVRERTYPSDLLLESDASNLA